MDTNCYAYEVYPGDGTTDDFGVTFPYLKKVHVYVLLDGVELTVDTDYEWTSPSMIHLFTPPGVGVDVTIQRVTPRDDLLDRLSSPSTLSAAELNLISLQLLYLVQEALCPPLDTWAVDLFVTFSGARQFEELDILGPVPIVRECRFPASALASKVKALTAPSVSNHVFSIRVLRADGVTTDVIGTLTIAHTTGNPTFSVAAAVDMEPGDVLYLITTTAGPNLDNFGVTFRLARRDIA